ncbi:MAG: alginate export family protein [Nitrospinales bacterium]
MHLNNFQKCFLIIVLFLLNSFVGISKALPDDQAYDRSGLRGQDRPKWKFLRFEEDWSGMKEIPKTQRTAPFDSLKYIPLTDDGKLWLSFGGRMRFRVESWSDFAFADPNDDTFFLSRYFLHSDLHLGDNLRVFVEGKSAHSTTRDLPGGERTMDVDQLELQQAFVDIRIPFGDKATFTIRPGRRELLKGKQRLVSPLPWGNTLRHWDGVSGILDIDGWNVEGFWTQFVPVQKRDFNEPDPDNLFFGIYGTGNIANGQIDMDLYWLGIDRKNRTFNGTAGDEERHTLGVRLEGKVPNTYFDYELEGAYQFGTMGSGNISAYMVATQVGYKRADWRGQPRFFLGFDYASGDDASGGDVETFNQLVPLGHAHLGFMDFTGRQNNVDFSHGVAIHPIKNMTFAITGHKFLRADADDALYTAGGGVLRAGSLGSSHDVGYEIDLTDKYKFNRNVIGLIGYSHFFAGNFIEESGSNDDIDFIYVMGIYTF